MLPQAGGLQKPGMDDVQGIVTCTAHEFSNASFILHQKVNVQKASSQTLQRETTAGSQINTNDINCRKGAAATS